MLRKVLLLFSQNKFLLFILPLVVIGVISRFAWLDRFPVGITHDETDIVLSGKYFFNNGTDASGVRFPISIIATKMHSGQTSVIPWLLAPYFGNIKQTLFNVRLPFVIVNLLTAFLVFRLTYLFSKKKLLAAIALLVFLFNPWSFTYSRNVIEAPIALALLLLGLTLLFSFQNRRFFLALPAFLLSFFVYWGAMPVVILTVIFVTTYHYCLSQRSKRDRFEHLLFTGLFLSVPIIFFVVSINYPGNTFSRRSGEVNIFGDSTLTQVVDQDRRQLVQNKFSSLYLNKVTIQITQLSQKYVSAFSPDLLFFSGDNRATYRSGQYGLFHIIDAGFLILGIIALSIFHRRLGILIVGLAAIAPVGSMLSNIETSYYFRSFLLLPVLVITISAGIWLVVSKRRGFYLWLASLITVVIYLFSFGSFLEFYFFRFPVTQQENNFLSERVLSKYVNLIGQDTQVIIVTGSPAEVYQEIVFFNGLQASPVTSSDTLRLRNIVLTSKCPDILPNHVYLVKPGFDCPGLPKDFLVVQDQKDSGTLYRIYNSLICNKDQLTTWRRYNLVSDYNIEAMNEASFCNRWINIQ